MSQSPSLVRPTKTNEAPQPYRIHVASKYLELTTQKFELTRLPKDFEQAEGQEWVDGTPKKVVEELIDHWQEHFDWRKQEALLNQLPNFRVPIEVEGYGTLRIHFLWKRSERKDAIPLLMIHGWPGNFLEFSKLLEPLRNPSDGSGVPAFHVIVPSLPGFAFSDAPKKPGFGLRKIAETLDKLMKILGYDYYVAQGGDWGYMICRTLALRYPHSVRAIHVNMLFVNPPSLTRQPIKFIKLIASIMSNGKFPGCYSQDEILKLNSAQCFLAEESGYQVVEGTKPLTLSYGLTDSPVGLLALIREKLHSWTDNYPWTHDEILTWFMLYWTPGPYYGFRLYKEGLHEESTGELDDVKSKWSDVPLGYSVFPKDICSFPADLAAGIHPLKFFRKHSAGGRFAAWERPDELLEDIREFFGGIADKDTTIRKV